MIYFNTFIQPTQCGFNFLDNKSSKCILKHHLYPSKMPKHSSGDWYWVNTLLKIELL